MKLLMIGTDRNIFDKNSAVAKRQIEYAKKYEEVHIIIFSDKTYRESVLGSNIFIYPTRSRSRWFYILGALSLGRFIVEKKGITYITCQDPFETGLVGALIKSRHNVELELQIHTDIGSRYFQTFTLLNRIRMIISRFTLHKADHVRVVSERIKKYVSRYVDSTKIEVRPIAVNLDSIKSVPVVTNIHEKYPQFSKIILMVSRIEREKNIDMALRALKIVLAKVPTIGLIIVGSGSEMSRLKSSAQSLGIENNVVFEGWQNDTVSYYKTSDCFLNTSWYEGYGMSLVEAHAVNLPIVSTDVGIAQEVGAHIVGFSPDEIAQGLLTRI